jgi:ribonucleoside-diphosphate reductase alpha chain
MQNTKSKLYLEIDHDCQDTVIGLLNNCKFEFKFRFVDLDNITAIICDQQTTINHLENRITDLEEDVVCEKERANNAETKVKNILLPSSKKPPPHFKLPDERPSITHEFTIGESFGHGTITVGLYPESNEVGELFVRMKSSVVPEVCTQDNPEIVKLKEQIADLINFLRGILDQLAISVSIGLQRGIPLVVYTRKFRNTSFPPSGFTDNKKIRSCSSIIDYLFRWLEMKFVDQGEL